VSAGQDLSRRIHGARTCKEGPVEVFDTLAALMAIPGPTGQEHAVLAWLRERWDGRIERLWTTKVGNLLALSWLNIHTGHCQVEQV